MRARILAILSILAFSSPALAQSNPGLVTGQVPTASDWNSYFSAKKDNFPYTALNKAGDSMSGPLRTTPTSSANSGFSLQQGTAPTSPNNGDTWMTTAGLFYRANGVTYGPITGAITCASMPAFAGAISSAAGTCTTAFSATVPIASGGTGQTSSAAALAALGGAPLASPTFTGAPLAPTPTTGDNSTKVATTAYVQAQGYLTACADATDIAKGCMFAPGNPPAAHNFLTGYNGSVWVTDRPACSDLSDAVSTCNSLASPAFTGTPTAPTALTADNSTTIATTAFVKAQGYVTSASFPVTSVFTRTGAITAQTGDYAFSQISGTASVAQGGTGSGTAGGARTNLAVPGLAVANVFTSNQTLQNNQLCFQLDCNAVSGTTGVLSFDGTSSYSFGYFLSNVAHLANITAGSATLNTPLSISNGGTGQTSASTALTALGGAPTANPTFTGTVNTAALTGTGAIKSTLSGTSGGIRVDAASATFRLFANYSSGVIRWGSGANSASESGANAGSDWVLRSYDDAGSLIGTPITVTRSTGAVSLSTALTIASGGTGQTSASAALAALAGAPLASPALTGTPTAPTASGGTNTTQVATTAFVQAAVSGGGVVSSVFGRSGAVVAATNDYNFTQLAGTAAVAQGGTGSGTTSGARTNLAVPGLATSNTYPLNQIFGGNLICFGFDCATPGSGNTAGVMSFDGFDTFTLLYKSGAVHTAKLSMDALTLATPLADANIASAGTWNAKIGPTSGSAIQKANAGGLTAATSGTDYAPATTGSSILKASSGGFANAVANTDYLPVANPTFTGTITGPAHSASSSITLTTGAASALSIGIQANGAAGTYRNFSATTGNSARWVWGADNSTESGSNNGSNFQLCRVNDAGSTVMDCLLTANRSTGTIQLLDNVALLASTSILCFNNTANDSCPTSANNSGLFSYDGTSVFQFSAKAGGLTRGADLQAGSLVLSGTPLAISSGGTGAVSASGARSNLGVVQEYLGTQFDKTNITPAGVTGLGITTVSGGIYHFRQVLFIGADATAGFRIRMGGTLTPASITYTISGTCDTTGASLGFPVGRLSDITTVVTYTAGCTSAHVTMDGVAQVTTGGSLIPQFALGTGSGPTSSVQVNSYAEYTKLN